MIHLHIYLKDFVGETAAGSHSFKQQIWLIPYFQSRGKLTKKKFWQEMLKSFILSTQLLQSLKH